MSQKPTRKEEEDVIESGQVEINCGLKFKIISMNIISINTFQ